MGTLSKTAVRATQVKRKRLYTLLAVAKKQLGLSEDEYRAILEGQGAKVDENGKVSASTLSLCELDETLKYLKRMGFKPSRKPTRAEQTQWRDKQINKAYAIWCALADHGIVKNRSMSALHKYAYRITHKTLMDWATAQELNKVIESLKKWALRERVPLK